MGRRRLSFLPPVVEEEEMVEEEEEMEVEHSSKCLYVAGR